MDVIANLRGRGLVLPEPPAPAGAYDAVVERAGVPLAQVERAVGFDRLLGLNRIEGYLEEGWDELTRARSSASQVCRSARRSS